MARYSSIVRVAICALAVTARLWAHDIITTRLTFSRDIYRIFANRCLTCHGAGSSIPLTTYEEVRPWAVSIKEQVLSRSMPPWGAVKGFGDLAPDHGLSQEEIMIIAAWVIGGAPQGNPALLPKQVTSSKGSAAVPLKDGLVVETRCELREPLQAAGVRPLAEGMVESARIVAKLPDGRIEPLLWLYHFDPKLERAFTFRRSLDLPPKTVI
ncbi:MAG: cytochrome c, partial [Acidobacteriaceae bacterium]|nr:cytochrome c [Acidobacteriaceae bacterium]